MKKDALTGVAVATYLFDSSTAPFLAGCVSWLACRRACSSLSPTVSTLSTLQALIELAECVCRSVRFAQSGSDATSSYQFLRAVLLFPQDLVYGGIPSYAVSKRAFIPDSNHPILVRLSTKVTAALTVDAAMHDDVGP